MTIVYMEMNISRISFGTRRGKQVKIDKIQPYCYYYNSSYYSVLVGKFTKVTYVWLKKLYRHLTENHIHNLSL